MTLMVALSHTDEGSAALAQGRELAARLGQPVVVFDLDTSSRGADRRIDRPETAPDAERWLGPAHSAPVPADDLLDTARELGVDLIVVGIRRRTPVGKVLLGSLAQRIILGSHVPVLSVKATGDHE